MSTKSHQAPLTRRSRGFVVVMVALSVLAALAVGTRAWRISASARPGHTALTTRLATPASPQGRSGKQRIEGEIIAITPHGFEPAQITRPAGAFLLVVDNRSGLSAITLLLNGEVGLPLRNVLVGREKRNWSDVVDLPRGNYTLREAAHPGWVCHITIR